MSFGKSPWSIFQEIFIKLPSAYLLWCPQLKRQQIDQIKVLVVNVRLNDEKDYNEKIFFKPSEERIRACVKHNRMKPSKSEI